MNILTRILDEFPDEQFLKADGFDDAVIGCVFGGEILVYSVAKCIEILQNNGMTEDEARDYFSFNVAGAYMGEQTPIWVDDQY